MAIFYVSSAAVMKRFFLQLPPGCPTLPVMLALLQVMVVAKSRQDALEFCQVLVTMIAFVQRPVNVSWSWFELTAFADRW